MNKQSTCKMAVACAMAVFACCVGAADRWASRATSASAITFDSAVHSAARAVEASPLETRESTRDVSDAIPFRSDVPTGCVFIFR